MKKILLSVLFIGAAYAGNAQVMAGVEGGLNMSNYWEKSNGYTANTKYLMGARAGVVGDIEVAKNCYVQTAIFYMRNGRTIDVTDAAGMQYNVKVKVNTVEVPVNFVYKLGKPGKGKFFAGAGMFIAGNVSGTVSSDINGSYHHDMQIGPDVHDDLKIIDLGMNVNAGYQLKNGIFIKAAFQAGLVNINPQTSIDGYTVKSRAFGLTVGYLSGRASAKNKGKEGEHKPRRQPKRHAINTED